MVCDLYKPHLRNIKITVPYSQRCGVMGLCCIMEVAQVKSMGMKNYLFIITGFLLIVFSRRMAGVENLLKKFFEV